MFLSHKNNNIILQINRFCSIYIAIWAISPPLNPGLPRHIVVMTALIWLITGLFLKPGFFLKPKLYVLSIYFYSIYTIIMSLFSSKPNVLNNQLIIIIFLFLGIVSFFYVEVDPKHLIRIFWISIPFWMIWVVRTLVAYAQNPFISRLLAKKFIGIEYYLHQGIGGYGLVYSAVFILPSIIHLIRSNKLKISQQLILSVFLSLCIIFIFFSQYTIALTTSILSIMFSFFNSKKMLLKVIFILPIILIVLFIGYYNRNVIMDSLIDLTKNTLYSAKLRDIRAKLNNSGSYESVEVRMGNYTDSIRLFAKYPFFGAIGSNEFVGGHSDVLDNFAEYGIFIGILFVFLIVYLPLKIFAYSKTLSISQLIVVSMVSLFDTIPFEAGIFFFFVLANILILTRNGTKNSSYS